MWDIRNIKVILTILIVIYVIQSLVLLGKVPQALYWDELAIGIDAYSIAHTGRDIHGNNWLQGIYPSYGDYKAPLPILLVSQSVKLFGLNEFSVRLPFFAAVIAGVLALLWIAYLITKKFSIQSNSTHYFLLALIALTIPWVWHFSHIGFESGMSFGLVALSLALFIWGLLKKPIGLIMGSFLAVLSVYTYFSARIIIPLFIIITVFTFRKESLKVWKWVIVSVLIFYLGIRPLYASPFFYQSEQLRWSAANIISDGKAVQESSRENMANGNTLLSRLLYHRYVYLSRSFLNNYVTHFSPQFLFLHGDANLRHHSGWGGMLSCMSLPFLAAGLFWLLKNVTKPLSIMVLGWAVVAPVTASIPYEVPHASRSIYLLIPILLIIYLGIVELLPIARKFASSLLLIVLGVCIVFGLYLEDYRNHYSGRSQDFWQVKNKTMALEAIRNNVDYEKIIIDDSERLPALSVLFYDPTQVVIVQPVRLHLGNQEYHWLSGFGKYSFGKASKGEASEKTLIIK